MLRLQSLASSSAIMLIAAVACARGAAAADTSAGVNGAGPGAATAVEEIVVTAAKLNAARAGIQTQTGASSYTVDAAALAATPGGDNTLLDQVVLQAPSVAQDSFGQFHVRGDHNDLQYRLNGIILPEGIAVFGQSLSPRLINSLKLITGALPAEYGLRTAGIIDLTTKSGVLEPGGTAALYGGSHGTFQPSADYGGRSGGASYFVSGDLLNSSLGIESPDGSAQPLHDHSVQWHGFGYLEDILDAGNRLSLIMGTSSGQFQIPDRRGLQPALGLDVNGQVSYPSEALDSHQRELTHYAIVGWQHAEGALNVQSALTTRYSSLTYQPDALGELLYNGIAQRAFKSDLAFGLQSDASYRLGAAHTLRGGIYAQHDAATSSTASQVLPVGAAGLISSDVPLDITDGDSRTQWLASLYLQDEWRALAGLTVNYGLRLDRYRAYSSGGQLSPRLNVVWKSQSGSVLHGGYARYFTPPPFELVGGETVAKFLGTTAAPSVQTNALPRAERADYWDLGFERTVNESLTLGVDSYYRQSQHLIDEGQFGAPIIQTPFNYRDGRIQGVEFTANYTTAVFSAYGNLAVQSALGRGIEAAQFNFSSTELAYIAAHYIHLDHEQRVSASAGAAWRHGATHLSADLLVGSGLRANELLADGSSIPNGAHLPAYVQVNLGASHAWQVGRGGDLTARFDVINAFDRIYEIRDGTGVGVGAPQFGARRGLFLGLAKAL